jgi:predicted TIM-barrel fold metal-dependent hydrolase
VKYRGFDVIDVNHHLNDVNHHLNTDVYDDVTSAYAEGSNASMELNTRLATMDAQHVQGAVVIASSSYVRPRGLADTMAVNDAVAAYRDREPSRFVAAVGDVDPLYGPAGVSEVKRCRDELGLAGISLHGMGFIMRPLIEKVGKLGLVPFVHVGTPNETIWQVDSLAKDFPDLTMVVLYVFNSISQIGSLAEVAGRRPNLYFDLSGSISFETLGLPHLRTIGADRFLYGTYTHSWPLHTKPFGELLADIVDSDLSQVDKAAILSGNIKRILNL